MAQISLTLPDGNAPILRRRRDPAEVAAEHLALAGEKGHQRHRGRRPLGPAWPIEADAEHRHPHHEGRRPGAGADPPRPRPHHGPRGAGDLARREGHHRPGHRERLVLRFRPDEPFTPEDLGEIESRMRRSSTAATRSRPRSGTATAPSYYDTNNEPYKVELVGMIPEGSRSACTGTATGRTSAAGRICSIPGRFPPTPSS
jgi:threonyl-tRNA synthetase